MGYDAQIGHLRQEMEYAWESCFKDGRPEKRSFCPGRIQWAGQEGGSNETWFLLDGIAVLMKNWRRDQQCSFAQHRCLERECNLPLPKSQARFWCPVGGARMEDCFQTPACLQPPAMINLPNHYIRGFPHYNLSNINLEVPFRMEFSNWAINYGYDFLLRNQLPAFASQLASDLQLF